MNIGVKETNRRKSKPLVKSLRTERRVKENVKIYYFYNCLL